MLRFARLGDVLLLPQDDTAFSEPRYFLPCAVTPHATGQQGKWHLTQGLAMRHSFFYLQRQVEVNVLENGGTWRWAFVVEGHPSHLTDKGSTATASGGLREACTAAKMIIDRPLSFRTDCHHA